jgi:hypothetical protein
MTELLLVGLAGFLAAMVDGALGMGFGPTSSSILLSSGVSPAIASATVNIAKVASGIAGALAHWRLGNIDRRLVLRLAAGGTIGAIIGTTVLANVDGDDLRPWLAVMLALVAVRILVRFSKTIPELETGTTEQRQVRGVEAVGLAGGITNGLIGAWGPVATPFLVHRMPPRVAIGSVNTAEVAVAVVSVTVLLGALGSDGLELDVVAAMLIGGVLAAPLAAYLIRYLPARALGLAVAGLLLTLQTRELANTHDVTGARWVGYTAVAVAVAIAGLRPRLTRSSRASTSRPER